MKEKKEEFGVKNQKDIEHTHSEESVFCHHEKKSGDVAAKFYTHM